jgi:hypothetical protein
MITRVSDVNGASLTARRHGTGRSRMVCRREFIQAGAAAAMVAASAETRADAPTHLWSGYDFGPGPAVADRLDQGPFGIEQDEGWYTIEATTPADGPVRNVGLGLLGYTFEEGGPSLAVREGRRSLEDEVAALARLPFVDAFYLRCDWRDVQRRPGRLELHPVFGLTREAARSSGRRFGFRVQLSNPEHQPERLALPDFVRAKVPLVTVRSRSGRGPARVEPRYDHPDFRRAFRELVELLAAEFDGDDAVEFVDLMMYGFWGEGHTGDYPGPFPDQLTAERTTVQMARLQIEAWKRAPLAVNTQPDISGVGNSEVLDLAVRAGCWLRSDSVILDEPVQIEELANRPPWLAAILEDGYYRRYRTDVPGYRVDAAGVDVIERTMLHTLDLGANYWSLWTESDDLRRYHEARPRAFEALQRRLGYRVRPSWVWQRKRHGTSELVVAFANDGVAGVPGVLRAFAETPDGRVLAGGGLDAGHPLAGRLRQASFVLPPGLEGQRLRLRAEIELKGGVRRPVRWACAQPLAADGSLPIELLRFDDRRWRKGI